MKTRRLGSLVVVSLLLLRLGQGTNGGLPVQGQEPPGYFPETGHTIKGRFLAVWEQRGGLAQFGYPLDEEFPEVSELDGRPYTVQYFERAVFEYHPEYMGSPADVQLSLLGLYAYQTRYGGREAGEQHASTTNPRLFPETGHTLGGPFRAYWEQHGGLAQQGYPISDEFPERSALDGHTYMVQYFQRAVLEWHPENTGTPYAVLLQQLGRQRYQAKYGPPPPPPPAFSATANIRSVDLVSPDEGWAIAQDFPGPSFFLHYQQGRWTPLDYPSLNATCLSMISAAEGWALGAGRLLHYQTGHWYDEPSIGGPFYRVQLISAHEGWAVGGAVHAAYIMHLIGDHWAADLIAPGAHQAPLVDVDMLPTGEGWAVGGVLLHRPAPIRGELQPLLAWEEVPMPVDAVFHAVDMVSTEDGWAFGRMREDGATVLLHYRHGQWTQVPSPLAGDPTLRTTSVARVQMLAAEEGWAVGDHGVILHYSGGSWSLYPSPTTNALNDVAMLSRSDGWAVGERSTILHYQNGIWIPYRP